MVACCFKPRFEDVVREGFKTQTIVRANSRLAAVTKPGNWIQLILAPAFGPARNICLDVRCTEVMKVVINFAGDGGIERILTDGVPVRDLDAFAVRDGFRDADDMAEFWRSEHGPVGLWHGVVIEWAAPRETRYADE